MYSNSKYIVEMYLILNTFFKMYLETKYSKCVFDF